MYILVQVASVSDSVHKMQSDLEEMTSVELARKERQVASLRKELAALQEKSLHSERDKVEMRAALMAAEVRLT